MVGPKNERTEKIAEIFGAAKIPCRISENIQGELWTKLIWNCALNAVSALGRVTYGEIIESEDARKVVEAAVYETLRVAHAKGIQPAGLEDPQAAIAGSFQDCRADEKERGPRRPRIWREVNARRSIR